MTAAPPAPRPDARTVPPDPDRSREACAPIGRRLFFAAPITVASGRGAGAPLRLRRHIPIVPTPPN